MSKAIPDIRVSSIVDKIDDLDPIKDVSLMLNFLNNHTMNGFFRIDETGRVFYSNYLIYSEYEKFDVKLLDWVFITYEVDRFKPYISLFIDGNISIEEMKSYIK